MNGNLLADEALLNKQPLTGLHVSVSAIITVTFTGDSRIWGRPSGASC